MKIVDRMKNIIEAGQDEKGLSNHPVVVKVHNLWDKIEGSLEPATEPNLRTALKLAKQLEEQCGELVRLLQLRLSDLK